MVRSLRGIASLTLVAVLSACAEYPGEGVVDTRDIREKGDVQEITGKVFGIKEGYGDAISEFLHDDDMLGDLRGQVWAHVIEGSPAPTIVTKYGDFSDKPLKEALALMIEEATAKRDSVRQDIADKVADLEESKQEQVDTRKKAENGAAGYEAAIADAKADYDGAKAALESAITRYNKAIESPVTNLNVLAAEVGLSEIPSHRNPIKSYRYSEFKDGDKPASCQSARNKFVLNMLDSHNQCMYFVLPSGYEKHDAKVTKILKASVTELEAATANLGKKSSWGRKGTGAYATLDAAKSDYEAASAVATKEFGDNRRRAQIIKNADHWIAKFQQQIDELSSDAEYEKQIGWTSYYPTHAVNEKIEAYRDGLLADFQANYVTELGDVTKNEETGDGVFEVEAGFASVVTMTDALISSQGQKVVLRHMGYADLTDPKVKEADAVTIVVDRKDLDRRPRDESIEKIHEDLFMLLVRLPTKAETNAS